MVSKKTVNTMLASAVALTVAGGVSTANAMDMEDGKEKCYGVVKAGHNDCGNAAKTHSCAGSATEDGDAGEWIGLPAGVCDKLVGGSTTPIEASAEDAVEAEHDEEHGDDSHDM